MASLRVRGDPSYHVIDVERVKPLQTGFDSYSRLFMIHTISREETCLQDFLLGNIEEMFPHYYLHSDLFLNVLNLDLHPLTMYVVRRE